MDDVTFLRRLAARNRVVLLAGGVAVPLPVSVVDDPGRAGAAFRISLISPEGDESGDGRTFLPGTIDYRELPLPLLWQWQLADGHKNAVVVGRIDYLERTAKGLGNGRGVFDTGPWGREAERMVRNRMIRFVSGDYTDFDAEILDKVEDKDKRIRDDKIAVQRSKLVAATIVAKPAFEGCEIEIVNEDDFLPDGIIEAVIPITASAARESLRVTGNTSLIERLERLEALEREELAITASAAMERVNAYRLQREREAAVARIRGHQNLTAAWKPLPSSFLSAKAKAQPRDMKGRWIEIGSMARWRVGTDQIGGVQRGHTKGVGKAGGGAPFKQGRVKSFDAKTGMYEIEPMDGSPAVKLKGADIEIVKAVIPESPTEAQKINAGLDEATQKLIGDTDVKMSPKEAALREQLGDAYVDDPGNRGYIEALMGDEKLSAPKGDPDATINIDEALGNEPKSDAPPVTPEEMIDAADQQKKALGEAVQAAKAEDPEIKGVGLDRLSELMGAEIESGDEPFETNRETSRRENTEARDITRAAENDRFSPENWPDRETLGRQLFNNLHRKGETWEKDGDKYLRAGDRLRRLSESKLISKKRKSWIKNTYGRDAAPIADRNPSADERTAARNRQWQETWAPSANAPDAPDASNAPNAPEHESIAPLVTKLNDLWGNGDTEPESPTAAVDLWAAAKGEDKPEPAPSQDAVSKLGGDIVQAQKKKNAAEAVKPKNDADDPLKIADKAAADGTQWGNNPKLTPTDELEFDENGTVKLKEGQTVSLTNPPKPPAKPTQTAPQFGSNSSTKEVSAPTDDKVKTSFEPAAEKSKTPDVEHSGTPSEAELESAKKYSVNSYGPINAKLRTGESSTNSKYPDDVIDEHVKNLDSMIGNSKSTKDTTLYRGLPASVLDGHGPGSIFTDKAFVSSTTDRFVAEEGITKTFDEPAALLEINAPKGTNMLDMDAGGSKMGESEFLLPRGSRFEIREIVTDENGTRRVIVDVLPPEGETKPPAETPTDELEFDEKGSVQLKQGQTVSLTNLPKPPVPKSNITELAKTMFQNLHPTSSWDEADQDEWLAAAKKKAQEAKNA